MSFVHETPEEFTDLVQIIVGETGMGRSVIEKDYWVTHVLWALSISGLDVWFKGGTSLSKGFGGLIERFSEDLDLKIEQGSVSALPSVSSWKSEGTKATAERRAFFEQLPKVLVVPGCTVEIEQETIDKSWRGANLRVLYPGLFLGELPSAISGNVRLEVGSARVTPHVAQDLTSWIHEKLVASNVLAEFGDNRAKGVRCVHPLVTLLEKLDALHRRFPNDKAVPAAFVRHYEDAARLIEGRAKLPRLNRYDNVRALADEMLAQKQIVAMPSAADPALRPC
ncbi:MAG TPA: nucleotidyl transferase AbiEii/AbiGii toxin family protein [Polyangiaceae bacterium]|nr:nucleotidyl transferase AbiEii/AbiGii toxin family protein [Polyangiaceae bacterium]